MALHISIIAPDRTVWDANAEEVILPSSTGQLGILRGHAPLLTALDIGVMRVRIDKDWTPIVLMGGFAEVENDELTILVNGAEEGSKIDKDQAQKELEEMTLLFNEATSSKERIEATQNLRKATCKSSSFCILNKIKKIVSLEFQLIKETIFFMYSYFPIHFIVTVRKIISYVNKLKFIYIILEV